MASVFKSLRKRLNGESKANQLQAELTFNRDITPDPSSAYQHSSAFGVRRSSFLGSSGKKGVSNEELIRRFRESVSNAQDVITTREEFLSKLDGGDLSSSEVRNSAETDILGFQDVLLTEAWAFQENTIRRTEEAELHLKALQTQRVRDVTRYRDSIRNLHQDMSAVEDTVRQRSFESILDNFDEATQTLVRSCVEEEMKHIFHEAERNREGVLFEIVRDKFNAVNNSFEGRVKEAQKDTDELRWQVKELRKQLNSAFHELAEARFNEQETNDLRLQAENLRVKLAQARQEIEEAQRNLSRSEAMRLEQLAVATAPVEFSQSLEDLMKLSSDVKQDELRCSRSTEDATPASCGTAPFADVWRASLRSESSTGHLSEGMLRPSSVLAETFANQDIDLQTAHIAIQPVGDEAAQTGDTDALRGDSSSDASGRPPEKQEGDSGAQKDPSGASAAQLLAHARSLNDLLEDEPKKGRDLLGTLEQVGDKLDKEILDEALAVCPSELVGSLAIALLVMRVQGARRECAALRRTCTALLDVIAHWYASSDSMPNVARTSRISEVLKVSRGRLTQCFLTVWQGWSELAENRKRARDLLRQQKANEASAQPGEEPGTNVPTANWPTPSWMEESGRQPSGTEKVESSGTAGTKDPSGWGLNQNSQSAEAPPLDKSLDHWSCDRPVVSSVMKASARKGDSRGNGKGRPKSATEVGSPPRGKSGDSTHEESNTPVLAFEESPSPSSSGLEGGVTKLPAIEGRSPKASGRTAHSKKSQDARSVDSEQRAYGQAHSADAGLNKPDVV